MAPPRSNLAHICKKLTLQYLVANIYPVYFNPQTLTENWSIKLPYPINTLTYVNGWLLILVFIRFIS